MVAPVPLRRVRTRASLAALALALAIACLFAGAPSVRAAAAAVTLTGEVGVMHEDLTGRAKARNRLVLRTERRAYVLPARSRTLRPGTRVRVRAKLRGRRLAVRSARRLASSRRVRAAAATTTRRTAVVMVNWASDPRTPFTAADARSTMFTDVASTSEYFREQSFGGLELGGIAAPEGDVFGWYTISASPSVCEPFKWASEATAAAAAAGVDLTPYDHIVYAFPRVSACGWSGLAFMPGRESWINGAPSLYVAGHELGHNLSLDHANARRCTRDGATVAVSPTCTDREYGDPFDIMGRGYSRHVSNFHKRRLGWFGDGQTQTIVADGTYTIEPAETFGPVLARVPLARPAGQEPVYYWLEYRRPFGTWFDNFAATDPAVNGLTIRRAGEPTSRRAPVVLDAHPETAGDFRDAPLLAGESFTDPEQGVTITAGTATSLGISFDVSFASPPDLTAPSAPAPSAAAAAGGGIRIDWSEPPAADGVATYRILRASSAYGSLSTRATLTGSARSWTDSAVDEGEQYWYTVVAYDAFGNGTASARVSATAPNALDTQAPYPPAGLAATVAGTTVTLAWPSGWDDRGIVRYVLSRDGRPIATIAHDADRSSYSHEDAGLAPGVYTYAVTAEDAAGNVSAPRSSLVTIGEPEADVTPPVVTGRLRAGRRYLVVSAAAADAAGVSRMWAAQDGRVLARRWGAPLRASIPWKRLRSRPLEVWAADRAGNVGVWRVTARTLGARRRFAVRRADRGKAWPPRPRSSASPSRSTASS